MRYTNQNYKNNYKQNPQTQEKFNNLYTLHTYKNKKGPNSNKNQTPIKSCSTKQSRPGFTWTNGINNQSTKKNLYILRKRS